LLAASPRLSNAFSEGQWPSLAVSAPRGASHFASTLSTVVVLTRVPTGMAARSTKKSGLCKPYGKVFPSALALANTSGGATPMN